MRCPLTRSQRQPSGSNNDFEDDSDMVAWWVTVIMKMVVTMKVTIMVTKMVIESHFARQSPTQLTVPFDSSLLEGAFAGVNIAIFVETQ